MATTETKKSNASVLFSLANNHNISQKEAFAMAKEMIENQNNPAASIPEAKPVNDANPVAPEMPEITTKLETAMKAGNVRFSFINEKGKLITTVGTLRPEAVPTTRKVDGSQTAKTADMRVFYDVRHGIYRQFNVNKVVEITNESVKRGRVKGTKLIKTVKIAVAETPAAEEPKVAAM